MVLALLGGASLGRGIVGVVGWCGCGLAHDQPTTNEPEPIHIYLWVTGCMVKAGARTEQESGGAEDDHRHELGRVLALFFWGGGREVVKVGGLCERRCGGGC